MFSKTCNFVFLRNALARQLSTNVQKLQKPERKLIINCKRRKLNLYSGERYDNLKEIPLASKGWNDRKSVGDYFTILPNLDEFDYPHVNFDMLNVDGRFVEVLKNQGIHEATSFQSNAINAGFSDHHIMLSAETGCGKTIAYLLPIIQKIIEAKTERFNQPQVLILAPSRELAHQIGNVATMFANAVNLNVKTIVGGHTKRLMLNPEFSEVDILVSTPGVIGKLSTVGVYKLDHVKFLVLDECDTLIDDSFLDRIEMISKRVSQAKLILVSATTPKKLPDLLEPYESNMINISSPRLHKPLQHVLQKFIRTSKTSKPSHLLQTVKKNKAPLLIFANRNETCNWVAMFLRENGVNCANINGDMHYEIRKNQWNDFRRGVVNVLSATDIASRGLDTVQVDHVVNYDFPIYAADYIHRIGRIGRLGSPDTSRITNLVASAREIKLVQEIELAIRKNSAIPNVDGNITNLVRKLVLRKIDENL